MGCAESLEMPDGGVVRAYPIGASGLIWEESGIFTSEASFPLPLAVVLRQRVGQMRKERPSLMRRSALWLLIQ